MNNSDILNDKDIPVVFKAFCDENRIRILKLLLTGEKCACVLLENLHISQPTLSHHMKILCDSGVVSMRKEGKWAHYSLSPDGIGYAIAVLEYLYKRNELSCNSAADDTCCVK
ncbi:MAG TPA: ArsR family transcriptional regulator [Desulfovibrio sp.]|uniref:ArsR/SmtB family transcription factor n=1 Tax=Taurinivorans muris TaxID=2787751 RepID=UPI000E91099E|nr:ArsR family transcriptional regulator [Desulfovibrio sp.]